MEFRGTGRADPVTFEADDCQDDTVTGFGDSKRMQKKRKKIIKRALLAIGILYLVTWGIHITTWQDSVSNSSSSDNLYNVPNPPFITAYLGGGREDSFGIPFLFIVGFDKPPYNLNLVFWVNSTEGLDSVVVSNVRIKHKNGKAYTLVQQGNPDKRDAFHTDTDWRSVMETSTTIRLPDAIKHSSSFTIETEGYLQKRKDKIPFKRTTKLKYRTEWAISCGWYDLLLAWSMRSPGP